MGFLDWLTGDTPFRRYDDSFATTREALWKALRPILESPEHAKKSIWLVTHFVETFELLQDQLESWDLDYEIVSSKIEVARLRSAGMLGCDKPKLILSALIPEEKNEYLEFNRDETVALMVVERHPQITRDHCLQAFAESLPVKVQMGYFLSLDDVVVKMAVNENSRKVLRQLGLSENDLIHSNMITRRLEKILTRLSEQFSTDLPADSASEWLQLNRKK